MALKDAAAAAGGRRGGEAGSDAANQQGGCIILQLKCGDAVKYHCKHDDFILMKIYVHLDEDSAPLPPYTLKIDDASSLSVSHVIEQFCAAYAAKVNMISRNLPMMQ